MPPVLANFLYPVISMSTNKDEPSHVYLLEEGLELWLVVIENSTTLSPELLEMSTNILSIIGMALAEIRFKDDFLNLYFDLKFRKYIRESTNCTLHHSIVYSIEPKRVSVSSWQRGYQMLHVLVERYAT